MVCERKIKNKLAAWQHRNLKKKMTTKKQKHQRHPKINQHNKKWVTFTYFSPIIRCITNLFKHSNLNIAFRATNTVQQQLSKEQINNKNPSGIYKRKYNTCNKVYAGQSGTSINVRHGEHVRYIRTNNPQSAYALHILQNRHVYGPMVDTLQLLKILLKRYIYELLGGLIHASIPPTRDTDRRTAGR